MFKTPEGGGDQPKPLNGLIGDYVDKVVDMTKLTGIQQKNGRQYWSKSEKGFYISPNINSHSEFVPGPSNAAKLELMSDPLKNNSTASHYVFVKDVSVGWGLNYTTSQTVAGKTFYPHDVSYKYAMVRGQNTGFSVNLPGYVPRIGGQAIPSYYGQMPAYLSNFRLTTGVARYTGTMYTVPTEPYPAP